LFKITKGFDEHILSRWREAGDRSTRAGIPARRAPVTSAESTERLRILL